MAVKVMTIVVPRSGSLNTSTATGSTMIRNGIVPPQKLRIRVPRFACSWHAVRHAAEAPDVRGRLIGQLSFEQCDPKAVKRCSHEKKQEVIVERRSCMSTWLTRPPRGSFLSVVGGEPPIVWF